MLGEPDRCEEIMGRATACIVTRSEHVLLSTFDKTHDGWDRYIAAGIDVFDMADHSPLIANGRLVKPRHP